MSNTPEHYEFSNQPSDPVSSVEGFPSRPEFESRTRAEYETHIATFHPTKGTDHDEDWRTTYPDIMRAWQDWQDANADAADAMSELQAAKRAVRQYEAARRDDPQPDQEYETRVLQRAAGVAQSKVGPLRLAALRAIREYDRLAIERKLSGEMQPRAWSKAVEAADSALEHWEAFKVAFAERDRYWEMAGAPDPRERHYRNYDRFASLHSVSAPVEQLLARFPDLHRLTPPTEETK